MAGSTVIIAAAGLLLCLGTCQAVEEAAAGRQLQADPNEPVDPSVPDEDFFEHLNRWAEKIEKERAGNGGGRKLLENNKAPGRQLQADPNEPVDPSVSDEDFFEHLNRWAEKIEKEKADNGGGRKLLEPAEPNKPSGRQPDSDPYTKAVSYMQKKKGSG